MDGENNGSKPYEQMDDLGVFPYFWKHPTGIIWLIHDMAHESYRDSLPYHLVLLELFGHSNPITLVVNEGVEV